LERFLKYRPIAFARLCENSQPEFLYKKLC
jgi:hypothetical protein